MHGALKTQRRGYGRRLGPWGDGGMAGWVGVVKVGGRALGHHGGEVEQVGMHGALKTQLRADGRRLGPWGNGGVGGGGGRSKKQWVFTDAAPGWGRRIVFSKVLRGV